MALKWKNPYSSFDLNKLLSKLIELESEVAKYKDQAESIYKWFAYYQDKCRIMEKKTDKFVIPEFPDEDYPAGSGPLKF